MDGEEEGPNQSTILRPGPRFFSLSSVAKYWWGVIAFGSTLIGIGAEMIFLASNQSAYG